jgi:ABC-type amino acid transport substrate-binding protein
MLRRPVYHPLPITLGLFALIALAASSGRADANNQNRLVLRTIAQEGSAPKYISGGAHAGGHCPDILKAIEKVEPTLRFSIDPTPTPIRRIEHEMEAGRIDVICALLDTPTRNRIAHRVSTPIYHVRERLVGRRDAPLQIRSLEDLARPDVVVVTQSGASYAGELRAAGIQVSESTGGSPTALRQVLRGRADYYYINELTGAYYLRAEGLNDRLQILPPVLQETPSYLWVNRNSAPDVIARLESAIERLHRSGELDRIYRQYQRQKKADDKIADQRSSSRE